MGSTPGIGAPCTSSRAGTDADHGAAAGVVGLHSLGKVWGLTVCNGIVIDIPLDLEPDR